MAITPEIDAPQGGFITVTRAVASGIRASQSGSTTIYQVPSYQINATAAGSIAVFQWIARQIEVTQATVTVVQRGRVANPRLRAWTFTLDGHDFYVLRLGDAGTLVYDVYSKQWVDWSSKDEEFWRANTGINWLGATGTANMYGSNIVVGDDTFGLLWFLDPNQPYDQHPDYSIDTNQYFERIAMGQVPMAGRAVAECYVCYLSADLGNPAYMGAGVSLYTSDDAGYNFTDQGLVQIPASVYDTEIAWRSLGQITSPGRLFKIVDDGALTRIDDFDMNDDGGGNGG